MTASAPIADPLLRRAFDRRARPPVGQHAVSHMPPSLMAPCAGLV